MISASEFWLRTGPEDVARTTSLWAVGGAVWLAEAGVPPAPALGWRDGERGAQAVALCGKPDLDRHVVAAAILKAIPRVEPGDGDGATRVTDAFTRERGPPGRHLVGRCAAGGDAAGGCALEEERHAESPQMRMDRHACLVTGTHEEREPSFQAPGAIKTMQ